MHARAANAYRRVDLESAPKQDVVVRLFERFLADLAAARTAMAKKDILGKARAIDHALRIVGELEASLDHAAAPELCGNLQALYRYVAERLYTANAKLDPTLLDDPTRIMTELAHGFREAQRK
jgi:flagellar protein FliS